MHFGFAWQKAATRGFKKEGVKFPPTGAAPLLFFIFRAIRKQRVIGRQKKKHKQTTQQLCLAGWREKSEWQLVDSGIHLQPLSF